MVLHVLLLAAFSAAGQQAPASPPTPSSSAAQTTTPAAVPPSVPAPAREYRNAALHLVYRYPVELQDQGPTSLQEALRRQFGTEPQSGPEYDEVEECIHTLLFAKTDEATSGTFEVSQSPQAPKAEVKISPTGRVILLEFEQSCVPEGAKEDDVLGSLASTPGQFPGMHPIDHQMWYDLGGHKVHFLAAQGTPDGTPIWVAAACTFVEGHLLMWLFESDDVAILNRLLKSSVQFGDHKPLPLMPLSIGNGPAVKLVP